MDHQAIYNTHSNAVVIRNKDVFDIDNNIIVVDQALVDAELATLQAIYDNNQYARDRATAYPPMTDQLDDIFHNGVAGWKKTIQAVKDTYPKP